MTTQNAPARRHEPRFLSPSRLANLNCRYGIPPQHGGAPAEPLIEIGVSLYRTTAQAQARVRGTVYDYV